MFQFSVGDRLLSKITHEEIEIIAVIKGFANDTYECKNIPSGFLAIYTEEELNRDFMLTHTPISLTEIQEEFSDYGQPTQEEPDWRKDYWKYKDEQDKKYK